VRVRQHREPAAPQPFEWAPVGGLHGRVGTATPDDPFGGTATPDDPIPDEHSPLGISLPPRPLRSQRRHGRRGKVPNQHKVISLPPCPLRSSAVMAEGATCQHTRDHTRGPNQTDAAVQTDATVQTDAAVQTDAEVLSDTGTEVASTNSTSADSSTTAESRPSACGRHRIRYECQRWACVHSTLSFWKAHLSQGSLQACEQHPRPCGDPNDDNVNVSTTPGGRYTALTTLERCDQAHIVASNHTTIHTSTTTNDHSTTNIDKSTTNKEFKKWAGRDEILVSNTLDVLRNDSWKVETVHPKVMSDVSCSVDGIPNEFNLVGIHIGLASCLWVSG
jgi:hypothetical protein